MKQSSTSSLNPHLFSILPLEDVLENVFEAPIVGLEDGVLGAHVQRPPFPDGILKTAVRKSTDGLCKEIKLIWSRFQSYSLAF